MRTDFKRDLFLKAKRFFTLLICAASAALCLCGCEGGEEASSQTTTTAYPLSDSVASAQTSSETEAAAQTTKAAQTTSVTELTSATETTSVSETTSATVAMPVPEITSVPQTTSATTITSAGSEESVAATESTAAAAQTAKGTKGSPDGGRSVFGYDLHIISGGKINESLWENRYSEYTGRRVISHPYSYYTLSDKQKRLYDKMVSDMLEIKEKTEFSLAEEITFEELFDIYQLIYNDEYRLFYISPLMEYMIDDESGYICTMKYSYEYDREDILVMKDEVAAQLDKFLSLAEADMTDYEIVRLFHDSIIKSCTYGEGEQQNTVYGCLVRKTGLCQSYSRTFTYLCSEAGIESLVVLGVADEPHMWNMVRMGEDYYHIDLTWDDPDRAATPDSVRYDYFGLTDERIRELRFVDEYDYPVPKASGTRYQYYFYNDLVAASVSEAVLLLERETLEAAAEKRSTIQFMCADDEVYGEVTEKFFSTKGENVISVLDGVKPAAAHPFNTDSVYHNSSSSTRTIKIFLEYTD